MSIYSQFAGKHKETLKFTLGDGSEGVRNLERRFTTLSKKGDSEHSARKEIHNTLQERRFTTLCKKGDSQHCKKGDSKHSVRKEIHNTL